MPARKRAPSVSTGEEEEEEEEEEEVILAIEKTCLRAKDDRL
jgi:hypothetical protein